MNLEDTLGLGARTPRTARTPRSSSSSASRGTASASRGGSRTSKAGMPKKLTVDEKLNLIMRKVNILYYRSQKHQMLKKAQNQALLMKK